MSKHNFKFFDFEVFPEWWCLVISDEEDNYPGSVCNNKFTFETEEIIKSKMRVYTSDIENVRYLIEKDVSTGILCGYNIKRYDLMILKCVLAGFTPRKLYIASQILINKDLSNVDFEHQRIADFIGYGWQCDEGYQDLMDENVKSLKDKECSLGMDIRETTVPFGKTDLTEEEKDDIIYYCKHDVYALHIYYFVVSQSYIDTKINLCDTFGLPRKLGYINTNAVLSSKVLDASRTYGTDIKDPTIVIRDEKLKSYFEKYIPREVYNHLLSSQDSASFTIYENQVDVGDGGVHSVLQLEKVKKKTIGLYVESTDEWTMYNVDVSSCYTSVMIYCDAMSRAIKNPARLKDIYLRRIKLKNTPKSEWSEDDANFVAAAKLVLNTTYGAMGNKYLPLYDEYMRTKVCRIGQMILIAISNCLYTNIPDLKVIQNNTDGVLVYTKRHNLPKIKELVAEFTNLSSFLFEIEEDDKIWQLNVNNYIAVHPDGEIKDKGGAFVTSVYQKGYNSCRPFSNFCVQKAQKEYYVNFNKSSIHPISLIRKNENVEDFCLTCTKGGTYDKMVQYNKSETVTLGKVARVIAVTNEEYGTIKKIKTIKKETKNKKIGDIQEDTIALCPPHPLIVNDALYNYNIENGQLIHKDGRRWLIDYEYYNNLLYDALDVCWYSLIGEELNVTELFNIV